MPAADSAPRILDLGRIEGPVLLMGGPCSNLQASEALLGWARRRGIGPKARICTGDVVAYGADARPTWALWAREAAIAAGNCERQLAGGAPDCGCGFAPGSACDALSRGWYAHARARIGPAERAEMATLPDLLRFEHAGRVHVVLHGGVSDIARYLWPVSPDADFEEEIGQLRALGALPPPGVRAAVVAGHCGLPFRRVIGDVEWINPGSLGLPPHDGDWRTSFAWRDGAGGLHFERLSYDAEGAAQAMRAAGLTGGYELSLLSGWWPSEEILPPALRRRAREGAREGARLAPS